jgi:hypothetical protein
MTDPVMVPGMDELIRGDDLAGAAECLRVVLAETDAEEIPAELDHVAYLRGAVDTLAMLATTGCPETKVVGCGRHVATGETFPQDG